jgi:dipeptidyl aminopeptidase/acylaminoacyl peptidase
VPVSDVVFRLEYQEAAYAKLFSAGYHVGKSVAEDIEEYRRRSPVTHAWKLSRPLAINTVTNDDDVSVLEVQRMIDSLKHHGKQFEYTIHDALPGAHLFERIDTREATDIRFHMHEFLEKHLHPDRAFNSPAEMRAAGYRFN